MGDSPLVSPPARPGQQTKRRLPMRTQMEKAEAFRALHGRPGAFIIPNPWDAGTAKLLAAIGFEALATTSLGLANMLGSATVSLDAIIENCRMIADATDLPVNADLENCGADDPNTAAKAIARAAEAGCVGGSIEDSTGDPQKRSEERRVGKECRLRWRPAYDEEKVVSDTYYCGRGRLH